MNAESLYKYRGGYYDTVDWTVDLTIDQGRIRVYEEDLWKDYLREYIEMVEDCDIECQRMGSGLSIVAFLNSLVLGLIGLNAVLMCIGIKSSMFRTMSVYCNLATCMCQAAVLVVSAFCIFSKYSMTFCARST